MDMSHKHLVADWFSDMISSKISYEEPILEEFVVDKLKLLCDVIDVDPRVFITTVDILSNYVRKSKANKTPFENPLLSMVTSISLALKCGGDDIQIKLKCFRSLFNKMSSEEITIQDIKQMEFKMLTTLQNCLPLHTHHDDLLTLIEHFISPMKLNYNLNYLCEEILVFLTINKMKLFANLKMFYMQNLASSKAFRAMYVNRLYIPIGVLVSAFLINSSICISINVKDIVNNLSSLCYIHSDHLNYLGKEIYELYKFKINNES